MSNVISVEKLSKRYLVGHQSAERNRNTTFRELLSRSARDVVRKVGDLARGRQIIQGDEISEFWALKDVSFEVAQGEVLGIIGRNGAGKSTLMKILSRITAPTAGRIILRGRVSSLLEVGTGFHPELTGRENIFLNGAILGMTQREIRRKFDEIVAFAEVEKFLDMPVKHYSSGMYVRLAFAVAAHLEPEILIVDEVLAVGDSEFQKKCLGKMDDVSHKEGRTILFVSHNMSAVRVLTHKCILLDQGTVVKFGNTDDVIDSYFTRATLTKNLDQESKDLEFFRQWHVDDDAPVKILEIGIGDLKKAENGVPVIRLGDKFTIRIRLMVRKALQAADIALIIRSSKGDPVVAFTYADQNKGLLLEPGKPTVDIVVGDLPLAPGDYFLDLGVDRIVDGQSVDAVFGYPLLSVVNDNQINHWLHRPWGMVQCQDLQWIVSR